MEEWQVVGLEMQLEVLVELHFGGGLRLLTPEVPEIIQEVGQGWEDWGSSSSFSNGNDSGEGIVYCLLLALQRLSATVLVWRQ